MPDFNDLYQFQKEGVLHLLRKTIVLLADEMGLGKTVQVSVAINILFKQNLISRVLIICPASLTRNWRKELKNWTENIPITFYEGPDRYGMLYGKFSILIGTYETITSDLKNQTQVGTKLHDIGLDLIILDEAQKIKDPYSIKAQVLASIIAPRRWALTGTPLENRPQELSSILKFLYWNEFLSTEALKDLNLLFLLRDKCIIRRIKNEVGIQIPTKTVSYVSIKLSPEQAAEYIRETKEIDIKNKADIPDSAKAMTILKGIQRLRKLAIISTGLESEKIDFLVTQIEKIFDAKEKAVIFSSFPNLIFPLVIEKLKRFNPVLYTGNMTFEEREKNHLQFINDPNIYVMCASIKAAGVGLTWTVASHVFHLDLWWNPQVLNQAEDRVHRIGQTKPVFVNRLVSEGTIEEKIRDLLESKIEVFNLVITEKSSVIKQKQYIKSLFNLLNLKSN